jgi:uncharacterized protein YbjT (DUF2867 family)
MARALLSANKTVRAVGRELRALQNPVAFLRPAWFMENFAWDVARARDSGIIASFLQPLDKPVPMIAKRIWPCGGAAYWGGDDHDRQ